MGADYAHELHREQSETTEHPRAATRQQLRARIVLALGPLTMAAGAGWALVQPYRITLLHPFGQGFWWLFSEPPLYVVLFGLLFRLVVAPALVEDLEQRG
ncbi:MAG TPA: hypothetical protein VFL60_03225 [Gaiellaceae bacterium]|nr:hypothetical protein [Gaiellaceae bacterium]